MFLKHLSNVYRFLGEVEPIFLKTPIKKPKSLPKPEMPKTLIFPDVDGFITHFFEWNGAGEYIPQGKGGAMFEGEKPVKRVLFGQDFENVYFLIELREDVEVVELFLQDRNFFRLRFPYEKGIFKVPISVSKSGEFEDIEFDAKVAIDSVIEVKIKGSIFDFHGRDTLKFAINTFGVKEFRIPELGFVETEITFPPFKKFLIDF